MRIRGVGDLVVVAFLATILGILDGRELGGQGLKLREKKGL